MILDGFQGKIDPLARAVQHISAVPSYQIAGVIFHTDPEVAVTGILGLAIPLYGKKSVPYNGEIQLPVGLVQVSLIHQQLAAAGQADVLFIVQCHFCINQVLKLGTHRLETDGRNIRHVMRDCIHFGLVSHQARRAGKKTNIHVNSPFCCK